ncbi:TonB-dependent receptor [Undibacterium sp. TS12]|uniref:TonB-dependent receptor plug domain-containing protein n=1 Tax=Undibacterium sp. TS12 TaxID=2908202 RepID=UPI001F4CEE87|nr:TonB-dependent receptor [Undibacterium sp. TS12]MCH8619981.1 TonB-dependent receptor [Undibacterium sp. TS12]
MRLPPHTAMLTAILLAFSLTANARTQVNDEDDDLKAIYGDKLTVSIATGSQKPLRLAPAVTSVITAADIRAMGATDLDQVLESVAGMHVERIGVNSFAAYVMRGIINELNSQILVLQNGVPMTVLLTGNRSRLWASYPLQHISRIEIIRGPGSALYGADAYSGVINIITKTANEIQGTAFGVRTGTFSSRDVWIQHGGKAGNVDVAAYLRVGRTAGNTDVISTDAQSGLDRLFGTHASLAPGPINNGHDDMDANLDLSYEKWRMRTSLIIRDNIGTGTGVSSALDPSGKLKSQRLTSDLSWSDGHVSQDWGLGFNISYMQYLQRLPVPLTLYPPGVTFPTGSFPNGMIGSPNTSERQIRTSAYAVYSGWREHQLRVGVGHDDLDMYDTFEYKNFLITPAGLPQPAGAVQLYTGALAFLEPHKRKIDYVYIQDEWQLAPDWNLTAGLRHDRYSDVGSTSNPRMALVWEAAYNLTAKLMYGAAFRAPSFAELYSINNPAQRGNPTIQPETIKTLEAALIWQPRNDLQAKINVFQFRMKNLIRTVPNAIKGTGSSYANTNSQEGQGVETELNWQASRQLRLNGNYSYQRNTDQTTNQDAGYAPQHHLFARADWQFAQDWLLSPQLNWVAGRKRTVGDLRPPVADYKILDISLRTTAGRWEVSGSVRNLLNADAREPSLAPGSIPNDIPLPGRSFYLQLVYRM